MRKWLIIQLCYRTVPWRHFVLPVLHFHFLCKFFRVRMLLQSKQERMHGVEPRITKFQTTKRTKATRNNSTAISYIMVISSSSWYVHLQLILLKCTVFVQGRSDNNPLKIWSTKICSITTFSSICQRCHFSRLSAYSYGKVKLHIIRLSVIICTPFGMDSIMINSISSHFVHDW